MKKCFVTLCTDEEYGKNVCIEYLINSLKRFHPDIPLFIFNDGDLKKLVDADGWPETDPARKAYWYKSLVGTMLCNDYEAIAFIDADSTVVGDLSDIFDGDYDIAVVRNNSDLGTAGKDKGITIFDPFKNETIPMMKYINAGLYVIKNKELWYTWSTANKRHGANFPSVEQDILNCIINSGRYNVKFLDPVGSNVSYGVSNVWGRNTHWDSWRESYIHENKLYIDNGFGIPLLTKVLHVAGGSSTGFPKQDFDRFFIGEVKEWLKKIVQNNMDIQLIKGTEMRPDNDKGLRDIINLLPCDIVMVEVGCYYGESTLLWEKSEKIKQIFAVDRWVDFYDTTDLASQRGNMKDVEEMFDNNIKNKSKIVKRKGSSVEVSKEFQNQSIDFIYIDASHKYADVIDDINAWLPILRPTGLLAGHDYNNIDVRRAVLDTIGTPDHIFEDHSWVKAVKNMS